MNQFGALLSRMISFLIVEFNQFKFQADFNESVLLVFIKLNRRKNFINANVDRFAEENKMLTLTQMQQFETI